MPQIFERTLRSEYIANHLLQRISTGNISHGDKLPTEEEMCNYYHVSRTTLREALQCLRTYGLLEVTPGRGTYVHVPSVQKLAAQAGLFYDMLGIPVADRLSELQNCITHALSANNVSKTIRPHLFQLHQHQLTANLQPAERATCFATWLKKLLTHTQNLNMLDTFKLESVLCSLSHYFEVLLADNDELLKVVHVQMFCSNCTALTEVDLTKIKSMLLTVLSEKDLQQAEHPTRVVKPSIPAQARAHISR